MGVLSNTNSDVVRGTAGYYIHVVGKPNDLWQFFRVSDENIPI